MAIPATDRDALTAGAPLSEKGPAGRCAFGGRRGEPEVESVDKTALLKQAVELFVNIVFEGELSFHGASAFLCLPPAD